MFLDFRDPKTKNFEAVPDGGRYTSKSLRISYSARIGLLIYYQNRGNGDKANGGSGIKAFPPGFKMISGNIAARSKKCVDITLYPLRVLTNCRDTDTKKGKALKASWLNVPFNGLASDTV